MDKKINSRDKKKNATILNKGLLRQMKRIVIVLVYLIIVCIILNYAKNFIKSDKKLRILINSNDITLKYEAFVKNDALYMSVDDIDKYFGANTYSEKDEDGKDTVISMSGNKILRLTDGEKIYEINNTTQSINHNFENKNGVYYLPVSEIMATYNIDIEECDNKVVNIELLNTEKKVAKSTKRIKVKFKETTFSKTIDKIRKNEEVTIVQEGKKWTKIMANGGYLGYVKTKYLKEPRVIREVFDDGITSEIKEKDNVLELTNDDIKESIDTITKSYDKRKDFILKVVDTAVKKKLNAVKVNFNGVKNKENYYRFLTELRPYLNEYSISLIAVKNDELSEERLKNIVNEIK